VGSEWLVEVNEELVALETVTAVYMISPGGGCVCHGEGNGSQRRSNDL